MPEGGRKDYNATVRMRTVEPGEPWFLIMGRDINSGPAVRDWAARAYEARSPIALVESALQQADALDAYAHKKVPDADHLTPAEVRQLEYQFDRRAWNARPLANAPLIVLAERRGYAIGKARDHQAETLLKALYAAALGALKLCPAGEASAQLQAAAAAAGLHLALSAAIETEAG